MIAINLLPADLINETTLEKNKMPELEMKILNAVNAFLVFTLSFAATALWLGLLG